MKTPGILTTNRKIIEVLNQCDRKTIMAFMNDATKYGNRYITRLFTKRYYIWNIIRSKDFYKSMSVYVVGRLMNSDNSQDLQIGELIIDLILKTAKSDPDRKEFIKSILRNVSILTIATLPYTSDEYLERMLTYPEGVIADDKMRVILDYIADMKGTQKLLETIIEED